MKYIKYYVYVILHFSNLNVLNHFCAVPEVAWTQVLEWRRDHKAVMWRQGPTHHLQPPLHNLVEVAQPQRGHPGPAVPGTEPQSQEQLHQHLHRSDHQQHRGGGQGRGTLGTGSSPCCRNRRHHIHLKMNWTSATILL